MSIRVTVPVDKQICNLEWLLQQKWPEIDRSYIRTCTLVDLFSGCGGLSLGIWEGLRIHRYRTVIKLALDTSDDALAVYRHNFRIKPDIALAWDINDLLVGELGEAPHDLELWVHDNYSNIDILVAGPPCQGHSDLNNNSRRDDPRNILYLKVARFVELTKPKIVIIENVPAVIHDKACAAKASEDALIKLGYGIKTLIVNASQLGLPQTRKRHILLAARSARFDTDTFCLDACDEVPISSYIGDIIDEYKDNNSIFHTPSRMGVDNQKRVQYLYDNDVYDLPNQMRPICHQGEHSYQSMYGRLHWDKPAQTITSGFGSMGQGRFVHPLRPRMITPHEAARIQGFPDFFDFSMVRYRSSLQRMIGNAVPPRISALLIDRIVKLGIL